jgi:organic hydroperoxide reductase OsmC/OhrA
MSVTVPGMAKAEVGELVATAHEVCPHSNATRGNIDVAFSVA